MATEEKFVQSLQVAVPGTVEWKGEPVPTGIFKEPVTGRRAIGKLGVEGDTIADLRVHGGEDMAVYAYPGEHYAYWRGELPDMELPWGMFGENLTTAGLLEDTVHLGDRFRVGTAELMVTVPRIPCYKLGAKFGRADMVKRFLQSGRSGFYFRVIQEGDVGTGDRIEELGRDAAGVSVTEFLAIYTGKVKDLAALQRVAAVEALPQSWRGWLAKKLSKAGL